MGLLEEIREAQWKPSTVCLFGQFMAGLSEEDRKGLTEALNDLSISSRAIFVAVRNYNFNGGDSVIRRHRRAECVCH